MNNGKGDKWRKTNFRKYYDNFPEGMGPKPPRRPKGEGQCCRDEARNMNGWCINCGDPCF